MQPGIVLAAVALALLVACPTKAESLKIGVIAPLTGGGAPWGLAAKFGAEFAAEDVNAKGGVTVGGKTYNVEIVAYDDQYKAAEAVAAYTRLTTQDRIEYVVLLSSASALALKQIVEDDRVVAFTSAASAAALDARSNYMFRLVNTPAQYVPPFVAWLKANLAERRVAIVNPNDETGWSQSDLNAKVFRENGFDVVATELFERGQKDFQPMLTKVLARGVDLIELCGTPPATAGLIVRQARELGFKGKFSKDSAPAVSEIVEAAGRQAAAGMINLLYVDTRTEGYRRLAERYRQRVGQEPNQMIVTYYDAVSILLAGIQKADRVDDTAAVVQAIAGAAPFVSAQGVKIPLGGKAYYGVDRQLMTAGFVGVTNKEGGADVIGPLPGAQ